MRYEESNSLFGGLLDDEGSFLHGSRSHCCWSLGLAASSQFMLPTPSRIHRTSLVCTPVPHVTEHCKKDRASIFTSIFIPAFVSRSREATGGRADRKSTRAAIYLRPVRGEPCRRARARSAYLLVYWPRAAAISRRQHDEFVVRPCDAKDFSILDTHSARHRTLKPYLSVACSIETIATDRWRQDPTDREIYVYTLCLVICY